MDECMKYKAYFYVAENRVCSADQLQAEILSFYCGFLFWFVIALYFFNQTHKHMWPKEHLITLESFKWLQHISS